MKRLSQHLSDLSIQAKSAEDRVAQAQFEARDSIDRQRDQVRVETEQALGKVKQRFNEAKAETRARLQALQGKVNSDFEQMREQAGQAKRTFESWQSANYATDKEDDALAAIDYAVAATKFAELQTLDAIAARAGGKQGRAGHPHHGMNGPYVTLSAAAGSPCRRRAN